MELILPPNLDQAIRDHAESTYPAECCGILGGKKQNALLYVSKIYPVGNSREMAAQHNRYVMQPKDVLQAEKEFEKENITIVGFYHSHPDHPAAPSQYDLDHASWPGLSYVIVNVTQGTSGKLTSWLLLDDRSAFQSQHIKK